MSDVLASNFSTSKSAKIAVAFAKHSGVKLIEGALLKCLDNGGNVEFVIGLDFHTTDAIVLQTFHAFSKSYPEFHFYCFSDPSDNIVTYHPKLYLFETEGLVKSIIGSSNLTKGGLSENIEVNVLLEMERESEKAESIFDIYARIKYQPSRFAPNDAYIEAYQAVVEEVEKPKNKRQDTKAAIESLRELEKGLPKPFTNPMTLQGWQKLVFSKLPNNEFQTSDMYKYVSEFAQTYPENKYVEAKIRQVLQQLRDLGIILHLGEGRWMKSDIAF
jgi:HKD family nuclease